MTADGKTPLGCSVFVDGWNKSMRFSERQGFVDVRSLLQTDGMSDELRNSLWNLFDRELWSARGFLHSSTGSLGRIEEYSRKLWEYFFKQPADERGNHPTEIMTNIRRWFFSAKWYFVYDFIEFNADLSRNPGQSRFSKEVNEVLERELAGFRIIDGKVVPITERHEVDAIENVISESPFDGAKAHIRQALSHLSNRNQPDYRNSIKESISAVESACREITNDQKATLGDALNALQRKGVIHGALKSAFSSLYGYTSDEEGIRHAMLEEPNLSASDAKYFVISCSSFVNYLASKYENLTTI